MPAGRPKDHHRRQELLAAVVESVAVDGIGKRSLRDIAEHAGTSHRMLIHHFESREGLLVAIVDEVERRTRADVDTMYAPDRDVVDVLEHAWSALCAEDLRGPERLFFECYARGANGEEPFDRLHPESVRSWLDMAGQHDVDVDLARLGLAVVRGLLLDLIATNDLDGTSRALALYADLVRARLGADLA
jgi:AcrR family transcriptional regulator